MASVYQVDALIRQRPGISLDELRKALGPDVSRPLKRLEARGYIRRVESSDRSISCSVIELLDTGRPQRTSRRVFFFPVERPDSPDSGRRGKAR
jgi:DNA-binding MarR family transcriptional regulator